MAVSYSLIFHHMRSSRLLLEVDHDDDDDDNNDGDAASTDGGDDFTFNNAFSPWGQSPTNQHKIIQSSANDQIQECGVLAFNVQRREQNFSRMLAFIFLRFILYGSFSEISEILWYIFIFLN